MKEIWKDIKGYEGLYKISNTGKVLTVKYGPKSNSVHQNPQSKIMSLVPTNHGYLKVELYNQNSRKYFYVHRLVAQSFIPNPDNKPQVNHIDGNKQNNHVDNLEWVTPSENQRHSILLGLRTPSPNLGKKGSLNKLSKHILQCDRDGNVIREWIGIAEAARNIGCSPHTISACVNGHKKTCKGFIWKEAQK